MNTLLVDVSFYEYNIILGYLKLACIQLSENMVKISLLHGLG